MPAQSSSAPTNDFEFTRDEQWAIHQALLEHIEMAASEKTDLPAPSVEIALLEKVEAGDFSFTRFELDRLRFECDRWATNDYAPERDRGPARSVFRKIDRRCPTALGR